MELRGRVALVTGAGRRLGQEMARALAGRGMALAVHHHSSAEGARALRDEVVAAGGRAECFAADLSDAGAARALPSRVATAFGRLDVLVNSAGVREISSVLDLPLEEWNRVMGVNVTGTFLCSQAFARTVIAKGGKGAIVNLASTLGVVAASNRPAYTASKHAVVGLTKEMAMELGEKGIRVNAVGPGVIRTPLTERYFQEAEQAQRIKNLHAMARWGEPDEIATAILFLASSEASFCTGTTLIVDGGWTAGKNL
jgi:NAD(P)-dependent dehydrogenase (short-subunit alcohol dehydrogenase family)